MEKAISGAVQEAGKEIAGQVSGVQKQLAETVSSFSQITEKLDATLKQHVEGIEKANEALAGQLQKVAEIGADVKEVLRIQEVVDGTVKTVTATEEFKQVLEALQKHLTESDALLREAARPRTIRLVESDGEVQQAAPVAAKAPEEPKASQTSEADSSS
jgi:methyl-accepting chemotaxis protein